MVYSKRRKDLKGYIGNCGFIDGEEEYYSRTIGELSQACGRL
jgi:hypothetical protein